MRFPTSNTDRLKKYLAIAVISLVLMSIAIVTLVIFLVNRPKNDTGTIEIEDVSPDIVSEINTQLNYSFEPGVQDYYSPTLDVVLKYPNNIFLLSEGASSLSLSPSDYSESVTLFSTLRVVQEDPKEVLENQYSFNTNYEVISTESIAETEIYKFKYTTESYINQGENNTSNHTVYITQIEDEYIYLNVREVDSSELTSKYNDTFIDIIESIDTDTSSLEQTVAFSLFGGILEGTFDRDSWIVNNQTESYFSLSYKYPDYNNYTTLRLNNYESYIAASTDDLAEDAKEKLAFLRETYSQDDFVLESDSEQVEIDGSAFYTYSYNYLSFDARSYVTEYIGVQDKNMLSINITSNSEDSEGEVAAKEVVEQLTIVNNPTQEDLNEVESSLNSNSVLGTNTLQIEKASVLGKPAVVHIFNRSCIDIGVTNPGSSFKSSYELCTAGLGSGSYINSDGHIITNAHVASGNPEDIALIGSYDPDGFYKDVVALILSIYPDTDLTDQDTVDLVVFLGYTIIADGLESGELTIDNVSYENYIQTDKPFEVNPKTLNLQTPGDHLKAEIVDYHEISSSVAKYFTSESLDSSNELEQSGLSNSPDLALLKVTADDQQTYPSIKLSNINNVSTGSDVLVIGFPGSAENENIFASSASIIPTLTSGTISAIKPNVSNSFDLIQIDASISHGNSGGPILNSEGELVGVATYGISQGESADFNAGVSVEEVEKLLSKNNVSNTTGDIIDLINKGLVNLDNDYYQWALEDFNDAIASNSKVSEVLNPLIRLAEEKIDKGEDNTPIFTFGDIYIHENEAMITGLVVLVFVFIILANVILFLIFFKKKKKSKDPVEQTPTSPTPSNTIISPNEQQQANPSSSDNDNANLNLRMSQQENTNEPVPETAITQDTKQTNEVSMDQPPANTNIVEPVVSNTQTTNTTVSSQQEVQEYNQPISAVTQAQSDVIPANNMPPSIPIQSDSINENLSANDLSQVNPVNPLQQAAVTNVTEEPTQNNPSMQPKMQSNSEANPTDQRQNQSATTENAPLVEDQVVPNSNNNNQS